jgi:hypothetical protein
MMKLLDALYHRTDALGAENFMNFPTLHHNHDFLQIGMKSPVGCPLRKAPVMPKGRYLSTIFALSHFCILSRNELHGINP